MWLTYLQFALQIAQVVNALLLTVHANPKITGALAVVLGAVSTLTSHTALNTMPPKEKA